MKLGTQARKNLTKATRTDSYRVPVAEMYIDAEFNARKVNPAHVESLTKAMMNGQRFPAIYIRADDEPGRFLIIDGQHRFLAAKAAGIESIDAIEVEGDDNEMIEIMLDADSGLNLTAIERAKQYQRLIDGGRTRQQIAERNNRSVADVNNHLMILEMPPKLRIQLDEGRISYAEALKLYRNSRADSERIAEIAEQAAAADGKDKVTHKYVEAATSAVEQQNEADRKELEKTSGKAPASNDNGVNAARAGRDSDKPQTGGEREGNSSAPLLRVSKPFGAAKARELIELLCHDYDGESDWSADFDIARMENAAPEKVARINALFRDYLGR